MIRVKFNRVVGGQPHAVPVLCKGCGKGIRKHERAGDMCPKCRKRGVR